MRGAPVLDLLAQRRFHVKPPRHSHRGHKHLRLAPLAIDQQRHGHAGIIDKQPFAGTPVLAHRHVPPRSPVPEPAAPGHIAHAVGVRLAPFLPLQLQGDTGSGQGLLDRRPIHIFCRRFRPGRIERRLQRLLDQVAGLWPTQPRSPRTAPGPTPPSAALYRTGSRWRARCGPRRNETQGSSSTSSSAAFHVPSHTPRIDRENPRRKSALRVEPNLPPRTGGYFADTGWLL